MKYIQLTFNYTGEVQMYSVSNYITLGGSLLYTRFVMILNNTYKLLAGARCLLKKLLIIKSHTEYVCTPPV